LRLLVTLSVNDRKPPSCEECHACRGASEPGSSRSWLQDDAKKMQAMARALRRDGWAVLTPTLSPSGCQVGNEVLAQQLSDFIEAKCAA